MRNRQKQDAISLAAELFFGLPGYSGKLSLALEYSRANPQDCEYKRISIGNTA